MSWKPTKKQIRCMDNNLCFKCETKQKFTLLNMGGMGMVESYYCPKCNPNGGNI